MSEDEKIRMIPSYFHNYSDSNDSSLYSINIWDKLKYLEADLNEMKEKLRKIERVMPWVSEDFEMDENKNM